MMQFIDVHGRLLDRPAGVRKKCRRCRQYNPMLEGYGGHLHHCFECTKEMYAERAEKLRRYYSLRVIVH